MLAQSVSKELATEIAMQYIQSNTCSSAPKKVHALQQVNGNIDTTYTQIISYTGKAPLYLVQLEDGWVLVSSELAGTPILASAPTGQFPDFDNMPDGMKWLLSYYEGAMKYAKDSLEISDAEELSQNSFDNDVLYPMTVESTNSSLPSSYIIPELALVHWNQNDNNSSSTDSLDRIYNKFCPTWYGTSNGHTIVGCTAVAMGMVMWYYKWPHSAYIPNTIDLSGNISNAKHLVTYNWNIIPTDIYNNSDTVIVNEVAGLLRDCGYASKMEYGANGSGASFSNL